MSSCWQISLPGECTACFAEDLQGLGSVSVAAAEAAHSAASTAAAAAWGASGADPSLEQARPPPAAPPHPAVAHLPSESCRTRCSGHILTQHGHLLVSCERGSHMSGGCWTCLCRLNRWNFVGCRTCSASALCAGAQCSGEWPHRCSACSFASRSIILCRPARGMYSGSHCPAQALGDRANWCLRQIAHHLRPQPPHVRVRTCNRLTTVFHWGGCRVKMTISRGRQRQPKLCGAMTAVSMPRSLRCTSYLVLPDARCHAAQRRLAACQSRQLCRMWSGRMVVPVDDSAAGGRCSCAGVRFILALHTCDRGVSLAVSRHALPSSVVAAQGAPGLSSWTDALPP